MAMRVLVTGGTGVLGREVVARLRDRVDVRVLSRRSGPGRVQGDLESGAGLAEAVADIDAIAHCASSASWTRPERDLVQTRNLVAAVGDRRPHLVYVSIVGVDRIRFGYYQAKYACERLVESSGLPWTVLRATQFHELVLMFAMLLAKGPVAVVPRGMRGQPVDAGEVADRVADLVTGPPAGRVPDFGGPRVEEGIDLMRAYLAATGRHKPVLRIPLFGRAAADYRAGHHLVGDRGEASEPTTARRTFADFLRDRVGPDGAVSAPYQLRKRPR
jgi:uncharacterized protein YbjT (DUF2867 family)